jgi:hypothetical protein
MQGLLAWVPILTGDNRATAEAEAAGFDDSRVRHVWDGERALADRYAKTLSLHCPAWDVYLLYEVGVRWDDTPPDPTFWTHQLPEKAGGQASSLYGPCYRRTPALGTISDSACTARGWPSSNPIAQGTGDESLRWLDRADDVVAGRLTATR